MARNVFLFLSPAGKKYEIPAQIFAESGKNYVVEERLGHGGNAVVHKCYDGFSGEEFAIKFLLNEQQLRKTRFEREKEFLSKCKHQHIVRYYDNGNVEGRLKTNRIYKKKIDFIVMELSEDGDLRKSLNQAGHIGPEIYTAQFRGLSDALAHMHGKGILHRDIKPENILIIGERWVISDLGLAAPENRAGRLDLTDEKEKVGPVYWMSPEATNKCLGVKSIRSKITKQSDVFQLASVFWFIVNRNHPSGVLQQKDWRGEVEIFNVLYKALQHNPTERFADGMIFNGAIVNAIEKN